jgi:hypothetical protein
MTLQMKRVVVVSGELILSKNPVEFVGLISTRRATYQSRGNTRQQQKADTFK